MRQYQVCVYVFLAYSGKYNKTEGASWVWALDFYVHIQNKKEIKYISKIPFSQVQA